MRLVKTTTIKGTLWDYNHLLALTGGCNLLVLSDRSLSMLQDFAQHEPGWPTRYALSWPGAGLSWTATQDDPEYANIQVWQQDLEQELRDMSCDIVASLNAIIGALQAMAANQCGCNVGEGLDTDPPIEGGPVPPPIGSIVFQSPVPINQRKCKAANWIHYTLRNVMYQLDINDVDQMGFLSLGLAISLVTALITSVVATPLVGLFVAVVGIVATFVARLLGVTTDLATLVAAMDTNETALVCHLYNSVDGDQARTAYLAELTAAGVSAVETGLLRLLMTNGLMALLYFDTQNSSAFFDSYTAPIDCSACAIPPTDWMILPSGVLFGETWDAGFAGTGTVLNDGSQFTITSSPRSDPLGAGSHTVAIVVKGFLDAQAGDPSMLTTPSGTHSGYHDRHSALPPGVSLFGRDAQSDCVPGNIAPPGTPPVSGGYDFQLLYYSSASPFSVTFSINTYFPQVCP